MNKKICKDCGGTGKLGFQREDCWFCGGSGFVLEEKIEDTVCENCEGINVVYIGNEHEKYYCKDCGYES
ncbi:hypothetical protein C672_3580 [[Clostridium] bifermentans ATCC 638]|uniref:Uncharacterized protein n=1 Tax=Paraclostridium bifermentans ATCC 638 = DSM 14991 TaxID=1233171 RepID=T4VGJ5_PARBF|nr:hypothetical protein [Paraclostridium bifermentans]EQK39802.1 hypothetical protein C672_3580 [[Clostridium] bifermentans ATCC 638] [Paraclostridium bifermentans ATCC 638 = DSM 14991]RIZ57411.1 hypothetical protein CHH45_16370 [Paraclostridium bifermentans]